MSRKRTHISGKGGRTLCGITATFQLPVNAPPMCEKCGRVSARGLYDDLMGKSVKPRIHCHVCRATATHTGPWMNVYCPEHAAELVSTGEYCREMRPIEIVLSWRREALRMVELQRWLTGARGRA